MKKKASRNGKGILRRAILRELGRTKQTPHSIAQSQRSVHPGTCMAYLYSGVNAKLSTVEPIIFALQMELARIEELRALRKLALAVKTGSAADVHEALNHVEEVEIGNEKSQDKV